MTSIIFPEVAEKARQMRDSESSRQMSVIVSGYRYDLHNMGDGVQALQFITKDPDGTTQVEGTTNEAVLQAVIHRLKVLNEKMHSDYNDGAIYLLEEALLRLYCRTAERQIRGVEGTHQA